MKKSTMNTIAAYIKNIPELANEYAELANEIQKDMEKADANRALYDAAKNTVLSALTDRLVTANELWAQVENDMPDGFTKNKMSYALLHYWNNEVIKVQEGRNPNQYRRKDV